MKWAQNSDSKTSKKELLEQISAKNPYVTFFLGHPVHRRKEENPTVHADTRKTITKTKTKTQTKTKTKTKYK